MLDYLGVTENWSAIENIPWTQRWTFSDDATGKPVSLDGVTFTGKIYIEGEPEPIKLDIQKSDVAEESNVLIVSCIGLPEGRHPYEIFSVSESGNQNRLISGYIGVIKSIGKLVDNTKTYASRTLSIRLPGHVTRQIRLEWNSCTLASISAEHALNAAQQAHADADIAGKAATTATGAATTATERAKEAEGYAGAAHASQVAAGNSAASASTSADDAARDASAANDAKTAMEGLASTWPQTVSNAEQTISAAREEAVTTIQGKQADSVLAVGRAQKTATDKVASVQGAAVAAVETAQTKAVTAVQTARTEAVETIIPLVERAETAKESIDQAESRIKTVATNADQSAQTASNAATAAQQALAAIPQVDAAGNMTLAGGITAAGTMNANGGINIPASPVTDTDAARKHEVRVLNEIANGVCQNFFDFSTPPFGRLLSPFSWLATYWPKPSTSNGWVDFNFRCDVFGEEFDSGGSYTGVTGVVFPLSSCLGYQRMFQVVAGGLSGVTLNEEWSGPDDHPFSDPPDGVAMWWDVYFGDRIADQGNKIPVRGRFCRYNHSTKQVELLTKAALLPENFRLRGIAIGWGSDGNGGIWVVGANEKTEGRLEAYRICDNTWPTSSYAGCVNGQLLRLLSNRGALRVGVEPLRLYTGLYRQKSVVAEWCEMMEVK